MNPFKQWIRLYRLGYLSNQSGIMRRFLLEEGAWENHLMRTRQCILNEISNRQVKSIAVLGSGWLLDIPLHEMLNAGAHVKLVDIAHPNRILYKYRNTPNLEFVNYDLTGSIESICKLKKNSLLKSEYIVDLLRYPLHSLQLNEDLCFSVNTLSQLHIHLLDFLTKSKLVSMEVNSPVIEAVQQAHLDFLPSGKSILITDFEELLFDDYDKLFGVNPKVIIDLSRFNTIDTWSWDFDTRKTYDDKYRVKLNVAAYSL